MRSRKAARNAAYFFLFLCVGVFVAILGYKCYEFFGPIKIKTTNVPFGVPEGTSIAIGDFSKIETDDTQLPVHVQAELRRASDLLKSKNFEKASEVYNEIALIYPDLFTALWGEVNALFAQENLSETSEKRLNNLIEKFENKYPSFGITLYAESRRVYKNGNTNAALEMARLASEKTPALFEIREWHAKLLLENTRYDLAKKECQIALSLSRGTHANTYELLAQIHHDAASLDSAELIVDYALSLFPTSENLLLQKGILTEYQGNINDAEKLYQKILSFNPDFKKANSALATLGEKFPPGKQAGATLQEKAQTAIDILKPLVDKYPENLPLREALGVAYLKGRHFDRAESEFNEIKNRDPDYPEIQDLITRTHVEQQNRSLQNEGLAANLNRAIDSLRGSLGPSKKHDFSTMLGHYLVRYGASPKEFFKKYAIENFRPVKENVWQESFYEAPYKHTYTIVFDSLKQFKQVHVAVFDSSSSSNNLGMAPEVFNRLLKQNSRISGIGNSTGETDCGDGNIIDAAVWETQDNFEILARFIGVSAEVRMVRFDKSKLPPGLKLCDYIPYLKEF